MPPPKILLVDDSATNRLTVSTLIQDQGYCCDLANNGEEALARCRKPATT